jgi:two-component system, OmpR family, response regulator
MLDPGPAGVKRVSSPCHLPAAGGAYAWDVVRILLVEDEPLIASFVSRGLRAEGYTTSIAASGDEAVVELKQREWDLVILDLMLPGLDGFAVLSGALASDANLPVLVLSAQNGVATKVAALDAGASDYLAKPFSFDELLARIRAVARRGPVERPTVIELGDLRLDPAGRRAWRGTSELNLTAREFAILELFMRRPGQVLTRLQLLDGAWDMAFESRSNIVDVYVRYLREKVDRPFGRFSIETVRGVGYRMREDGGLPS